MRLRAGFLLLGLAGCSERGQPPVTTPPAAPAQPPASVISRAPPQAPLQAPVVELVMDVMQVVGKSEAEVAALLGQPASCEDIHRARLCRYSPAGDEVMFVRGKADMITVQAMGAVAFNEDALDALGMKPATPDQRDEHAIRWHSIPGLEEVTVFPGQGNHVHYAYVKVGKH